MDLSRSTYGDHAAGRTDAAVLVSDDAFLARMVDVEVALTLAAGDAGAVEGTTAAQVAELLAGATMDAAEIGEAAVSGGNPAIPLVRQLKAVVNDAGLPVAAVHVGATSQDIIDTALVLCLRDALGVTLATLDVLTGTLADLAARERSTATIGRTLGQQAVPTTFGLTAAGWLQQLDAAMTDLTRAVGLLPVQYAGAAGNLAASSPAGLRIHRALAERLGLPVTPVVWHTDRTPVARLGSTLALVAGTVRKIAGDVVFLSATEIGELREAAPGGSSAMPHKANPAGAVAADGYARRAVGYAGTLFEAMDGRMQRAAGAWHAEWQTVRDLAVVTDNAVTRLAASLDGITVDREAMARNLQFTGGAVLAEALSGIVGRAAVDSAVAEGRLGGLIEDACRDHGFSPDPADHTGHAAEMVDLILADHSRRPQEQQ
jgi:3-carboxy-cis,cis-muconate cycloisomerase